MREDKFPLGLMSLSVVSGDVTASFEQKLNIFTQIGETKLYLVKTGVFFDENIIRI